MKQAIYYLKIGENIQKMDCIKRQKCKKDTKMDCDMGRIVLAFL